MLLILITGLGSLLRAALGPKTRASLWQAWSNYNDQATVLPDFLDHNVKESPEMVRISSEIQPVYVQRSMSQACWSGTGNTYHETLWLRRVASRSS